MSIKEILAIVGTIVVLGATAWFMTDDDPNILRNLPYFGHIEQECNNEDETDMKDKEEDKEEEKEKEETQLEMEEINAPDKKEENLSEEKELYVDPQKGYGNNNIIAFSPRDVFEMSRKSSTEFLLGEEEEENSSPRSDVVEYGDNDNDEFSSCAVGPCNDLDPRRMHFEEA